MQGANRRKLIDHLRCSQSFVDLVTWGKDRHLRIQVDCDGLLTCYRVVALAPSQSETVGAEGRQFSLDMTDEDSMTRDFEQKKHSIKNEGLTVPPRKKERWDKEIE